mgnify:CR=1 FL=1
MYDHRTSLFYRSSQRRSRTEMYRDRVQQQAGTGEQLLLSPQTVHLIQVLTRRGVRAAVRPRPTESHREAAHPDHPAIKAAVLPAAALQHPEVLLPTASRKVLMEPAATEKAQRIPTMTDMMTSIWTGITMMTVMPETATTRMASMMRWMSWGMIRKTAEKIANHVWRYEITDGI